MMHDLCENMRTRLSDFLSGSVAFERLHCKDWPVLLAVVNDDLNQQPSGKYTCMQCLQHANSLVHTTSTDIDSYDQLSHKLLLIHI